MTLPIDTFFSVRTQIAVGGVPSQTYGRGLVLTTDPNISAGGEGKVRFFTTADSVQDLFGSESTATKAAREWFSYNPYPEGVYIGRWAHQFVPTVLRGSQLSASATSLDALRNAAASFRILGSDVSVNTSAADSFAAVAQIIETELTSRGSLTGRIGSIDVSAGGSGYSSVPSVSIAAPTGAAGVQATADAVLNGQSVESITITNPGAGYESVPTITFSGGGGGSGADATAVLERNALVPALTGATFQFQNSSFVLSLASSEALDPPYFDLSNDAPDNDISIALGMGIVNATYLQGSEVETPSEAVSRILDFLPDATPSYLAYDDGVPRVYGDEDLEVDVNLWTYVETTDLIFSFTDTSLSARRSRTEQTSLFARCVNLALRRTMVCLGDDDKRPHIAALAALSSINWDQPRSIITLFAKSFPGIAPTPITVEEADIIKNKRGNFYTNIGGVPSFAEGFMAAPGYWADAVAFNTWMANELKLAKWAAARQSGRLSVAILKSALTEALAKGVRNGGLQPGRNVGHVTAKDIIDTTGNVAFDGVLTAGYLVYIGDVSAQTTTERTERQGPPIKIWAVGSEAIHSAHTDFIFEN